MYDDDSKSYASVAKSSIYGMFCQWLSKKTDQERQVAYVIGNYRVRKELIVMHEKSDTLSSRSSNPILGISKSNQ